MEKTVEQGSQHPFEIKHDKRFRFWVDMGSADETALDALYGELSKLKLVKEVKLGSRYYD